MVLQLQAIYITISFSRSLKTSHFQDLQLSQYCHYMEHSNNSFHTTSLLVIFLILVGVVYIFVGSPFMTNPLPFQESNFPRSDFTTQKFPREELDLVLDEASMPNKTLIIAFVNKAYVEQSVNNTETTILDVFLESFWLGEDTRQLLDHLLIVALDQMAYDRCKFKRLHCYKLVNDNDDIHSDDEKVYMSEGFIKMMWRRTHFLLDVLRRGYDFIFTDTDVMWVRNPFPKLCPNNTDDLHISVDRFNGLQPEHNSINTGFYYIRSNNKTISLFDKWYSQKDNSTGKKEQDVLEELIHGGIFIQLDLRVRILETKIFSGFCQDSNDVGSVTTIHANCCRYVKAKVRDLTNVLCDWKRFKAIVAMNPNATDNVMKSFRWSPHTECMNSWNY